MKRSLLLALLVTSFGLAACNKSAPSAPAYSGPQKAAFDAAIEKCKSVAFDSRDKCVKDAMAAGAPAAAAPAASKK